jgi:O-antigen ligase
LAIIFVIWGAIRTFPNLGVYGIDALRDGVIWAYFLFALIVFAFLDQKDSISKVVVLYNRFIPWYLAWIPFAYLIGQFWSHLLPVLPISEVPLLTIKPGDIAVHLAGIGAFLFLHPVEVTPSRSLLRAWVAKWARWAFWISGFLVSGSLTRGGLLSILSTFVVVLVMRPLSGLGKMFVLLMTALSVLLILDPRVDIGDRRIISPQQIIENFRSIARSPSVEMEATRQWRLEWWKDIVDYTLFGNYFWTGKGYGINLADSDGYQVVFYPPLRSPHNGHLNILARSGVPGLATWVLLQSLFVWKLLGAYFSARKNNETFLERTSLWVLAYWTAFIVNSCFDVFLEGPQGGIWFWALFGFGLAAIDCQRTKMLPMGRAAS